MKIMVVGSGGREHALVWKLKQSPRVKKIYAAPGNAGIAEIAESLPIASDNLPSIIEACKRHKIDLVVVGPELPLTLGLADLLKKEGIPCFGPEREAARLEGSKSFTKRFLREEGIPTAMFETFSDYDRAVAHLDTQAYPVVIKADGLAAGKGVFIAKDRQEAVRALDLCFKKKAFGSAGAEVVIEEYLEGQEASFHVLVDDTNLLPLPTAQDYKRIGDGDAGPNTGGMGAVSPNPFLTPETEERILREILEPTLRGLQKRGISYRGVLYAGLMLTAEGPKLLEYNVRFGDPEAQAILPRIKEDLIDLIEGCLTGLKGRTCQAGQTALCVVMAAHGYPESPRKGDAIAGLDKASSAPETILFHAGTKRVGDQILTDGGRVLGVTSLGRDIRQARERAYEAAGKICWRGTQYRRDIGIKALTPSPSPAGGRGWPKAR